MTPAQRRAKSNYERERRRRLGGRSALRSVGSTVRKSVLDPHDFAHPLSDVRTGP